jgi:hypothetical protein
MLNLSSDEKSRAVIKQAGGIPTVIEFLFSENSVLQLNTIMILANFAMDEKDSEEIHKLGGVLALVPLLQSDNESIQEAAGNIKCNFSLVTLLLLQLLHWVIWLETDHADKLSFRLEL